MQDVAIRVLPDGEKWWVWVNKSRFMGFKSEGDAVSVGRRLADIIAELIPADVGAKVTYTPMQPKAPAVKEQTPAAPKIPAQPTGNPMWRTR